MAILGIADDIFDIRWRHKVLLPAIASIPLLMVYYVDFNVTVIVTPKQLLPYLPPLFDLGALLTGTANKRMVLLRIYGFLEHLLHQYYQHLSWCQWTRGRPEHHHSCLYCNQRYLLSYYTGPPGSRRSSFVNLFPFAFYCRVIGSALPQLVCSVRSMVTTGIQVGSLSAIRIHISLG